MSLGYLRRRSLGGATEAVVTVLRHVTSVTNQVLFRLLYRVTVRLTGNSWIQGSFHGFHSLIASRTQLLKEGLYNKVYITTNKLSKNFDKRPHRRIVTPGGGE